MKKLLIVLSLTAGALSMSLWAWNSEASSGLNLSYSFVGCSGNQATYDLIATHPNGGTFTWSQGANVTSGSYDNPNYADTSFIKFSQLIWVRVTNKMTSEQVFVSLPNPCIYFP